MNRTLMAAAVACTAALLACHKNVPPVARPMPPPPGIAVGRRRVHDTLPTAPG